MVNDFCLHGKNISSAKIHYLPKMVQNEHGKICVTTSVFQKTFKNPLQLLLTPALYGLGILVGIWGYYEIWVVECISLILNFSQPYSKNESNYYKKRDAL